MIRPISVIAGRLLLVASAFTVLPAIQPAAAFAQNTLTPLEVSNLKLVSGATISPDGRYIAYTVAVPADPLKVNQPATHYLYITDKSTGKSAVVETGVSVGGVSFRPKSSTVTFLAAIEKDKPRALYEVAVTGGKPNRIWSFERHIVSYSWAPEGSRIAFVAFDAPAKPSTPIAYTPRVYEENLTNRSGYVVDVTSGNAASKLPGDGAYYSLVWSPDGLKLAVSVAPSPNVDDSYMFQSIKVLDAGTFATVGEIDNAGKLGRIVWSPDGSRLAIKAGHDLNDPIDGQILVVNATGGKPVDIYKDFEGKFEDISWFADNEIRFIATRSVESIYGSIKPDGSDFKVIAEQKGVAIASFSLASNGDAVFVASTPKFPQELFTADKGNSTFTRITNNNPWLDNAKLGEQRVIRYPARDNVFEIEGLLILPVDYKEGTRVPVIVNVHGGPESHYLNGWLTNYSTPGQVAAGMGMAVFYPNYRGSTGRGLVFSMSSQSDAAGKEFDDIVDGVDYLIAQGIADSSRIGVTGGSYGGYATAWMSTRYSDRFAAGVMFVGISNDISKWGTSDIPHELNLVHSRENMWEGKWQKYLERSAIYHVDKANTPLLIMHGEQDTRVHPAQSLELFRHIKVRKPEVPLRLVLYPGEGHGNLNSGSRLDYNIRMISWFQSFLQGDRSIPSLDIATPAR